MKDLLSKMDVRHELEDQKDMDERLLQGRKQKGPNARKWMIYPDDSSRFYWDMIVTR
jgi:hypothetical protein